MKSGAAVPQACCIGQEAEICSTQSCLRASGESTAVISEWNCFTSCRTWGLDGGASLMGLLPSWELLVLRAASSAADLVLQS